MKIKLSLNKKSLHEFNKSLTNIKNIINNRVNKRFLYLSLKWIEEQSIIYLKQNFPNKEKQEYINEIATSFEMIWDSKTARLQNNHNQAVYIEFGVGIVGQNTHPASSSAKIDGSDYKYNMPSYAKDYAKARGHENQWWLEHIGGYTDGNIAAMYMYNAFMDYYHKGIYREIYAKAMNDILKRMGNKKNKN